MRVKCINVDTSCYEDKSITIGKEYEVLHENGKSYCIVDDCGKREYHFKVRFEVIKEDKVEEVGVVRKLEDLVGLENGMGLHLNFDEINKEIQIYTDTELKIGTRDLDFIKCMGFKFEYKPLRSLEEVLNEARTKIVEFVHGKYNYLLVKTLEGYYVDRDVSLERVDSLYLCKELAQKYADELNEILKSGK